MDDKDDDAEMTRMRTTPEIDKESLMFMFATPPPVSSSESGASTPSISSATNIGHPSPQPSRSPSRSRSRSTSSRRRRPYQRIIICLHHIPNQHQLFCTRTIPLYHHLRLPLIAMAFRSENDRRVQRSCPRRIRREKSCFPRSRAWRERGEIRE
jgi:hypothetical protein